ncbi:MAG: GNAT family N-acetyltransferase [Acetobacteraceae bacterium]
MQSVLAREGVEVIAVDQPDPGLFAAIIRPLAAFNATFAGAAGFRPLLLALRAPPGGEVVGGLAAEMVYGWLSIQALFVPQRLRRQGIGARLLRAAEVEARRRDLSGMVVNTFSFQARPFYERMGFNHFGTLEGCPPGHRCFYLCKHLAAGAGTARQLPRAYSHLPPAATA